MTLHPGRDCNGPPCSLCQLAERDPRYARRWAQQPDGPPPFSGGLKQRDGVELVPCKDCPGNVRLKVPTPQPAPTADHMVWAVGLTTIPTRLPLLRRTLKSAIAAGFENVRLFVDGATMDVARAYEVEFGLETTARSPRVGAWGNWWLGLQELAIRQPRADRYAMLQDDAVFCRNLRPYLERRPLQGGYLNPFLILNNEERYRGRPGWHTGAFLWRAEEKEQNKWQRGCGALCLVFDRAGVELVLSSVGAIRKPLDADHRAAQQRIDGAVATAFNMVGGLEWTHSPSLVWHTGKVSSLDKRPPDLVARWPEPEAKVWQKNAGTFAGEDFDAMSLAGVGAAAN